MTNKQASLPGLSLVELLIAMVLMGVIVLSIGNFLIKSTATASSLSMRFTEAAEVQMVISDIQQDLRQGAWISNNSNTQRLEYTTYDTTSVAVKKIYRMTTVSGRLYLQLSLDNGTTWQSPYRASPYTKYSLQSSSRFLYAWSINNCTSFPDTNGDGVYTSGTDNAPFYSTCANGTSGTALTLPSQATKVDLQNFQFTTGTGNPEAIRTLATDIYISLGTPYVRSSATMTAPAVKDSPMVHGISVASSSQFSSLDLRAVAWDPSRERMILVGHNTANNTSLKIFIADRKGITIGKGFATATGANQLDSVAVKTSGTDILALDITAKMLYGFNLSGTAALSPSSSLNLNSPTNLINNPTGIAFDAATPNDFYIVGADPSSGKYTIYERNISSGALVGTAWTLPTAFDASHPSSGLAIEPINGDFIVVRNYVNGTGANRTIDIYIISRADSSSKSFSVNINDLINPATGNNSPASGITGLWGLAYEPITNRIFLTDSTDPNEAVYEVIPSQLISPRG